MSATIQQPILTLDEEFHVYTLGSRRVPGVNEILKGVGLVDDRWFTPESRDRGKAVHALCHYDDEGDLLESDLDERLRGYLRAYRKFKNETGYVAEANEQRVYHEGLGYAGTFDGLGRFNQGPCLPDIKSGIVGKVTRFQTVAYAATQPNPRTLWRLAVALDAGGDYSLTIYPPRDYDRDFRRWASIVDVFHLRKDLGI